MKRYDVDMARFLKTTGVFFVGSTLSKIVSFLMLPLYTSLLPSEGMGVFDVSVTWLFMLSAIIYFQIWSAILRFLYDCASENERAITLRSGLWIFGVQSVLFVMSALAYCAVTKTENCAWVVLYGLSIAAVNLLSFAARGLGRNFDFALSGVINTIVSALSNVVLIVFLKWDYSALYISSVIGSAVQVAYLCIRIRFLSGVLTAKVDRALVSKLFFYALPLCINTVAYWSLISMNNVVYNWIYGDSASGVFAIGQKFGTLINLATTCFFYAWQDISFSHANDEPKRLGVFYAKYCDAYFRFLSVSMVLLLPAVKVIFPIFVKGVYVQAEPTVPLFVAVSLVGGFSGFTDNLFFAVKATKAASITTLIAAVLNGLICYPMIRFFQVDGANVAILLSFGVNIMIRAIILKRRIGFAMKRKNLAYMCLWLTAAYLIYRFEGMKVNALFLLTGLALSLFLYRDFLNKILGRILGRDGAKPRTNDAINSQ